MLLSEVAVYACRYYRQIRWISVNRKFEGNILDDRVEGNNMELIFGRS